MVTVPQIKFHDNLYSIVNVMMICITRDDKVLALDYVVSNYLQWCHCYDSHDNKVAINIFCRYIV